jgi:hypothetical protein
MANGFAGRTNFFFSAPVPVVPGTTYFLQPVVQSGDAWTTSLDINYKYPGGTIFFSGIADSSFDMWFREGIIVPEPSFVALLLLGAGVLFWRRRVRHH